MCVLQSISMYKIYVYVWFGFGLFAQGHKNMISLSLSLACVCSLQRDVTAVNVNGAVHEIRPFNCMTHHSDG